MDPLCGNRECTSNNKYGVASSLVHHLYTVNSPIVSADLEMATKIVHACLSLHVKLNSVCFCQIYRIFVTYKWNCMNVKLLKMSVKF